MLRDLVRPVLFGVFAIGACIWAIVHFYEQAADPASGPKQLLRDDEVEIEWLGVLDSDAALEDAGATPSGAAGVERRALSPTLGAPDAARSP